MWSDLAPGTSPPALAGFNEPLTGAAGYTLPATQHDAVVCLAGAAYDVVFDVSRDVMAELAPVATLAHELVGWPYRRDLTGFEDGTENPTLLEATSAVVIEPGLPGAGGSVLLLQQWEHDAGAWEALSVDDQERAMGRRKVSGDELDPRRATSHVARTDQDQFGRIFRRNIGYGTLTRHGTIFVGFSRDRDRLDAMLASMIGRSAGRPDRLTAYTRAVTGGYYFVPSSEALAAMAVPAQE